MNKVKAFHTQHNAHIIPERFWSITITDDPAHIEQLKRGYSEKELTEKQIENIGDFRGVCCMGDLAEKICESDYYKDKLDPLHTKRGG